MKHLSIVLLSMVSVIPCAADTDFPESDTEPLTIVQLVPGVSPLDVARELGLEPIYVYRYALNGFAARTPKSSPGILAADSRVLRLEEDRKIKIDAPVIIFGNGRGPGPRTNWGLDRIDQRMLPLDGIYRSFAQGKGVTAYIIDSGIRYDHKEFGGRAEFGFDAAGRDGRDCNGHGTHVAGIVGGRTFGVAPGVRLISVAVFSCGGGGTTSAAIAGVDWVTGHHRTPSVANISLLFEQSRLLDEAIANMVHSGVVTAVAAGNNRGDACAFSPGRAREVLTIAATDARDSQASFSNFGRCVFLHAPGNLILSADNVSPLASVVRSGTSMASPHVTGAAALILEKAPGATPDEVRALLAKRSTKNAVVGAKSSCPDLLYSLDDES